SPPVPNETDGAHREDSDCDGANDEVGPEWQWPAVVAAVLVASTVLTLHRRLRQLQLKLVHVRGLTVRRDGVSSAVRPVPHRTAQLQFERSKVIQFDQSDNVDAVTLAVLLEQITMNYNEVQMKQSLLEMSP